MQDEHERASLLFPCGCEVHGQTSGDNDVLASRAPDLRAPRRFEAGLPCQCVPCFVAGMRVRRCRHARRENGFHVLGGVIGTRCDRQGPNLRYALSGGGPPVRLFDAENPDLAQGLYDRSMRTFCCFCCGTRGIDVQEPEHFRTCHLANGLVRIQQPTSESRWLTGLHTPPGPVAIASERSGACCAIDWVTLPAPTINEIKTVNDGQYPGRI